MTRPPPHRHRRLFPRSPHPPRVARPSLQLRPLRSAQATRRIKGVGANFYDLLRESAAGAKGRKPFAPARGRHSCVAAAALVALLELEEAAAIGEAAAGPFPMEDLLRATNALLDPRANASLNQAPVENQTNNNQPPGVQSTQQYAAMR